MKTERTRIKICGIREPAHARLAAQAGADAIGLVFYRGSPRFLEAEQAAAVGAALPPFVTAVALFVNEDPHAIRRLVHSARIDLLQFHGDETPEFCAQFGKPFVRAVRMEEGVDLVEYARRFSAARALLLDAHVPDQPGGTGTTFDWGAIPRDLPIPLILAGGLDVSNVGAAMRAVRPWAVDVSSGVESGRGVKDPAKIVEFIRKVRHEDGQVPA